MEYLYAILSLCEGDVRQALAELQALTETTGDFVPPTRPAVWLLQAELLTPCR